MALQSIFTKKYAEQLQFEVTNGIGLERYSEDVFPYDESQCFLIPNIEQPNDLVSQLDPKDDFKSAVLIYEAYKKLTPLQASDQRFWVTLTHRDLFRYVRQRWPKVQERDFDDKAYILDHWFYTSVTS